MKTQYVLFSAALLATAALPALAADSDSPKTKADTFSTLDVDADGQLSQEEAAAHSGLAGSFTMIDRNSDGFISKKEFRRNVRAKPSNSSGY